MKKIVIVIAAALFFLFSALLCSCSTTPNVEPLEKGEITVNIDATMGITGTLYGDYAVSFIPFPTVSVSWGVSDSLTAYVGCKPLLFFEQTLGLDTGVLVSLKKQQEQIPGFSLALHNSLYLSLSQEADGIVFIPEVYLNMYHRKNSRLLYSGLGIAVPSDSDLDPDYMYVIPKLGAMFDLNDHLAIDPEIRVSLPMSFSFENNSPELYLAVQCKIK